MTAIAPNTTSTTANRVTVATTATRIDTANTGKRTSVVVRNRGSVSVFIGGSDVTTAAGWQLDAGETLEVNMLAGNLGLYGIVSTGTCVVHVLQVTI